MAPKRRLMLSLAVPVVLVTSLAACGGGGDFFPQVPAGSETGSFVTRSAAPPRAPVATPTPARVTPEAYQRVLTDLDTALGPGFGAIGSAQTPEDLAAALSAVALNLTIQAGGLDDVRPPAAVAAAHTGLSDALGTLASELTSLAGDARDRDLCTGGSGLPRAASGSGGHLLRLAVLGLATADPAHHYTVGSFLPPGAPDQTRRPANGSLPGGRRGGYGELTVTASGGTDAVVKVLQGADVIRNVYVQAGASAKVDGIPNGTFDVFYTEGTDWDDANHRFTRDCAFSRFDQPVTFSTTNRPGSIEYTTYTLTLYGVIGGTASTTDVPPGAFPAG